MKWAKIMLTLLVCCIFSSAASARWVHLTAVQHKAKPIDKIVTHDFDKLTLSIDLSGFECTTKKTSHGVFTLLSLLETAYSEPIGSPQIPVIRTLIEIPECQKITVDAVGANPRIISLESLGYPKRVFPRQPPVPKLPGAASQIPFRINSDAYYQKPFTNTPVTRIIDSGTLRGHRLALIETQPIQYNPAQGKIKIFPQLTVTLRFSGVDREATERNIKEYYSPLFQRMLEKVTMEKALFEDFTYPGQAPVEYLVIVADAYQNSLSAWVNWKTKIGCNVTVVPVSTIGSTTSAIQNYLNNAYSSWPHKPEFVLFVGDTDTIPTYLAGSADDMAYTDTDGSGYWTPDILLGRWPVKSSTQLSSIIAKSLEYDQLQMTNKGYFKNSVWLASSDHSSMVEGTHEFCFNNYISPVDSTNNTMYKVYERLGGGTSDFASNVNAGRGTVCYSGHGYGDGTGTASIHFTASNVQALTNASLYPHVMVYACGTNLFNQTASFGEVWLTEADKGSVTYWGTSDSSYWTEDDILERKTFKSQFDEGQTAIAAAHYTGLIDVHTQSPSNAQYYFQIYNLMGDPSLDWVTKQPSLMSITCDNYIPPTVQDFMVTVSDAKGPVSGALVAISRNNTLLAAGYTNGSGQSTLTINPGDPGTILVQVTAHNHLPSTKNVTVQASSCGMVSISEDTLACGNSAHISLYDIDLNTNASTVDYASVDVTSDSDPTGITLSLSETGPNTSEFTGSVLLSSSSGAATIAAADGDTLHVTYHDAYCHGQPTTTSDTAQVDCAGPGISNISVVWVGNHAAVISFNTSEPSTPWIEYFPSGGAANQLTGSTLSTNHTMTLNNLTEYCRYFFCVGGYDQYGNFTMDNNQGQFFNFATWRYNSMINLPLDSDPGWTTSGQWAWGTPTGSGGGAYGSPDPTSGFTGTHVYGYNLNGDYQNDISTPYYLTSPHYDFSAVDMVILEYERWLGVEQNSYDHATVEVSNDGGNTWHVIWENAGSVDDGKWTHQSHDLSNYAANQSDVMVRFGMGPTDYSVTYCGWNIDDISFVTREYPTAGVPAISLWGIFILLTVLSALLGFRARAVKAYK